MPLNDKQLAILRAIEVTDPVSADDATWAVTEGLAVQAEDSDIDRTHWARGSTGTPFACTACRLHARSTPRCLQWLPFPRRRP